MTELARPPPPDRRPGTCAANGSRSRSAPPAPGPQRRQASTDLVERALLTAWQDVARRPRRGNRRVGCRRRTASLGRRDPLTPPGGLSATRVRGDPRRRDSRRSPPGPDGVALAVVGSVARGDAGPATDLDLVLMHDGRSWPAARVGELAETALVPAVGRRAAARPLRAHPDPVPRGRRRGSLRRHRAARPARRSRGTPSLVVRDPGHPARRLARRDPPPAAAAARPAHRARRSGSARSPTCSSPISRSPAAACATSPSLRALAASWVTDRPHGAVDEAHARLLDVRDALQAVTGRSADRLLLAEQDAVAVTCGLDGRRRAARGGRPGGPDHRARRRHHGPSGPAGGADAPAAPRTAPAPAAPARARPGRA